MSTIYKFPLNLANANRGPIRQMLENLSVEEVLHAGLDPSGVPCVWVKVFPYPGFQDRVTLDIVGTGQEVSNTCRVHVGSFVQGAFVWHVFTA